MNLEREPWEYEILAITALNGDPAAEKVSHPIGGLAAVVCDIDGTLSKENSYQWLTGKLGLDLVRLRAIYERVLAGEPDLETNADLLDFWNSSPLISRKFVEDVYREYPLNPDAVATLRWLAHDKRLPTALITSGLDLFGQIVAERIGLSHYYANAATLWDGDNKLVEVKRDQHFDVEKLLQLWEFSGRYGIPPWQVLGIGDDLEIDGLMLGEGVGFLVEFGATSPVKIQLAKGSENDGKLVFSNWRRLRDFLEHHWNWLQPSVPDEFQQMVLPGMVE